MAADTAIDPQQSSSAKSRKTKKKKSKTPKAKVNGETTETNGSHELPEQEPEAEDGELEDVGETPERRDSIVKPEVNGTIDQNAGEPEPTDLEKNTSTGNNSLHTDDKAVETLEADHVTIEPIQEQDVAVEDHKAANSNYERISRQEDDEGRQASIPQNSDTEERLAAAAKDRDELKAEVVELRKSLEEIQQRHEGELLKKQSQLEEIQSGKEHAETRYQKLLGQVNVIKAQLGERLKSDAAELAQARTHIEDLEVQKNELSEKNLNLDQEKSELEVQAQRLQDANSTSEEQNRILQQDHNALQLKLAKATEETQLQIQEISTLRSRGIFSQQNWARERDDLLQREAMARDEFEAAKQAMQDWEVLAMEERSVREGLGERVAELEEQLLSHRESYERAASERDDQSSTVDSLQRALHDIQEARKVELREMVENSQAQLDELRKQLNNAEDSFKSTQVELESAKQDLERVLPFEKEVKEKNLLIGKLRHEAVILNDHLTKALRFLKKGKPEHNVDRQLVTNHFLQFLALDRSDPKKFQILQLIAALLGWTDEQKESAGLARPGGAGTLSIATPSLRPSPSTSSLRFPLSPFRRAASPNTAPSPSTTPMGSDLPSPGAMSSRSESLAELWSDFLEREAQDGAPRRESTLPRREGSGAISPTSTRSPGMGSREPSNYGRF